MIVFYKLLKIMKIVQKNKKFKKIILKKIMNKKKKKILNQNKN